MPVTEIATSTRLKNWASVIDDVTLEQATKSSLMPFIQPYLALMPDAHLGKGATVGSVIPTVGAIMPAAVGVDIGCGMIAVRTQFVFDNLKYRDLAELRHQIERSIPLSAGRYNSAVHPTAAKRIAILEAVAPRDYSETMTTRKRGQEDRYNDWRLQLGTLGSGNHFIEVTLDEREGVWLFLHSGSRGIGKRIAEEHIAVAQGRPECRDVPDRDLSWLDEGTPAFGAYIADLQWAQRFALLNREEMMDRVINQFERWMGTPIQEQERIRCHHNFTQRETHFGQEVWLTRKGAISARLGEPGLIPGSMATASYVVAGKGNVDSFCSSPHGAGRAYSRGAAKRTFTTDQLESAMTGIEWNREHAAAFLDEIPGAYKDVDVVMRDASDLVSIVHTLHQIVNVKGD